MTLRTIRVQILCFSICIMYGVSLFLPAWYTEPPYWRQDATIIHGHNAFLLGLWSVAAAGMGGGWEYVLYTVCWLANYVLLTGVALFSLQGFVVGHVPSDFASQQFKAISVLGLFGTLLAGSFLAYHPPIHLSHGYYLWLTCPMVLSVSSFVENVAGKVRIPPPQDS